MTFFAFLLLIGVVFGGWRRYEKKSHHCKSVDQVAADFLDREDEW